MKLKTAIKGFYDTVRNPALRLDVVTFLRRYSDPNRIVTHYACRGESTKTIVGFLKTLGFEEDADYRVLASSFDAGSNSIRWTASGRKLPEMLAELALVGSGAFTTLAANLTMDAEGASAFFADRGDGEAPPPADRCENHFLRSLAKVSDAILAKVAEIDLDSDFEPNGRESAEDAKTWAISMIGNPERPFLLPIPVLEAYARACSIADLHGPWLFRQDAWSKVVCRVASRDDSAPMFGFLQGPIGEVLAGSGNPMEGYVYSDVATLEKADLADKPMCFAAVDAPMVFGSGEDLMTPVRMALGGHSLWEYVRKVLDACYPTLSMEGHIGLCANARVAISDYSETWHPRIGVPACVNHGTIPRRRVPDEERMTAKCVLILSEEPLARCYTDPSQSIQSKQVLTVRKADPETGRPDFTEEGLAVDESSWEWFAMTHGAKYNGTVSIYAYGRQAGDTPATAKNLKAFRRWKKTANGAVLAKMSLASSPLFAPKDNDGYDGTTYTPVSAFVSGAVPLALRLVNGSDRTLPMKEWKGAGKDAHPSDVVVSNVYSGIRTDLSPAVGTGDVFPVLAPVDLCRVNDANEAHAAAVTKWLRQVAEDGTQQVRFAQRTDGTRRHATLVVETNVDAKALLGGPDGPERAAELERRVGTAFVQNILLRSTDPFTPTDEFIAEAESTTDGFRKCRNHDKMYECIGKWRDGAFQFAGYCGLPQGTYERCEFGEDVTVKAVADSNGRLVLVFTASGDALTYARFVHRFVSETPLATAHTRSRMWVQNPGEFLMAPGAESRFTTVVDYMRRQHERTRSEDYSATNSTVPYGGTVGPAHREPFAVVAPGTAPSREWFTQFGTLEVDDIELA